MPIPTITQDFIQSAIKAKRDKESKMPNWLIPAIAAAALALIILKKR